MMLYRNSEWKLVSDAHQWPCQKLTMELYRENSWQLLDVIIFTERLYHRFFSGKISDSEPRKGNPRCIWNRQLIACEHVFELNFSLAISHAKSNISNEAKTAIIQIRVNLNPASDFEPTFECKWQYTYNHIFCKQGFEKSCPANLFKTQKMIMI